MADFSCPDWFEKLQAGRAPLPDNLPLDRAEADAAVAAFGKLRLPDVPGKPLLRDAGGQWAMDFVAAIFGLVDMNEDRTIVVGRKANKFFQLVPKKNSKTTNGAAIMLTALLRNRRPNAEFLLVGPTQETALRAYGQAEGMINADPWLKKRFHTREHVKTIEDRKNGSKLKVLSFDNKVMTGAKPVGVLIDELHELGKVAYAQKVMAQIEGGIIANPEGFVIIITTTSDEQPAGVFASELKHARAVRDGSYEGGETLPMLYEFPTAMQAHSEKAWQDPKLWPIVLPNLGRSISIDRLLPKFREAKEKSPEAFAIWASQHLNVEIGVAIRLDTWEGARHWERAGSAAVTLDWLLANSEVCTIGIDGGGLDDLLGLAVIGRHAETKRWHHWGHAWADRGVKLLRKEIASRLDDFEAEGDLTFVDIAETEDGANADVAGVADIVERVWRAGLLPEKAGIGVDAVGIAAILDELALREIPDDCIAAVPQGYRLSGVIKGCARKLKDGTLKHGARPMMAWAVGNARSEMRGSAVLVTKQASGTAKIDPLIALFNAFDLMSRNPEAAGDNTLDGYLSSLRGAA